MTAPMVNQAAPCEKDSLMNAVVDDGAAAVRDNFRSVVALAEGAAIDARCAKGCGRPSASRTKPCTEQSVSRYVAHGVRRHPDFGAWTGGMASRLREGELSGVTTTARSLSVHSDR